MTGDDGTHKKADRIDYAKRLLQKNFLPHIGLEMGANQCYQEIVLLGIHGSQAAQLFSE